MNTGMGGNLLGKRFQLGTGPKPMVDVVSGYIARRHSISVGINELLDQVQDDVVRNYVPLDEECIELAPCIVAGTTGDTESAIKRCFTRLSHAISATSAVRERFAKEEAPICLLYCVLQRTRPSKSTFFQSLGCRPKSDVRKQAACKVKVSSVERCREMPLALALVKCAPEVICGRFEKNPTLQPPPNRLALNLKQPLQLISDNFPDPDNGNNKRKKEATTTKQKKARNA